MFRDVLVKAVFGHRIIRVEGSDTTEISDAEARRAAYKYIFGRAEEDEVVEKYTSLVAPDAIIHVDGLTIWKALHMA